MVVVYFGVLYGDEMVDMFSSPMCNKMMIMFDCRWSRMRVCVFVCVMRDGLCFGLQCLAESITAQN